MDFQEEGWMAWAGFNWLRTGRGGGLLWMQWWTFRFHKMKGISWLADNMLASQGGLCSMEVNITAICLQIVTTTTTNHLYHQHHHHQWCWWWWCMTQCFGSCSLCYHHQTQAIQHLSFITALNKASLPHTKPAPNATFHYDCGAT
jgi:hypothetical protein